MKAIGIAAAITLLGLASPAQETQSWTNPRPAACLAYTLQIQTAPLTSHQKFCYFLQNKAFTPSAIFGAAFSAGYAQLTNNPKEWGGGTKGYAERFATRYAQGLTKSTTESFVGMLDHEDPRLHASSEAGTMLSRPSRIMPRLGQALLNSVWTPRDPFPDGSRRSNSLSYSRIAGSLASGFIGMSWTPDRINTVGQAFGRTGTGFAGYAATSVWTEFQPDVVSLTGRLIGQRRPKPSM